MCVISQVIYCGGYSGGDPPLPIPNREVKPAIADGTAPPGGRVGSCRSSRSGPSHRRPGPFVFIRCLLSYWAICPSGGPVPFFEVRTFTSKARTFCLYPLPTLSAPGGMHRQTRGRPRPREREGPAPTGVGGMERSGRFAVQTPGSRSSRAPWHRKNPENPAALLSRILPLLSFID